MGAVTRQVIDARTHPVTITTIPASRSELAVRQAPAPAPTVTSTPRRRTFPAVVAALVLGALVFGFTLGLLGVGVSSLISLATALGMFAAIYVLMTLFGGARSGLHCPGPWHN